MLPMRSRAASIDATTSASEVTSHFTKPARAPSSAAAARPGRHQLQCGRSLQVPHSKIADDDHLPPGSAPGADVPRLGPLSYPLVLLAGGLFIGFLLSLLARAMVEVGARRRKVLVAAQLHDSLAEVTRDRLVAPVQLVLDRHRRTREHLDAARTRG